MTFSLVGCRNDVGNRGLYGRSADHSLYGQLGRDFGGASYNADIGFYLAYNTTARRSTGTPVATDLARNNTGPGGTVTPVGNANNPNGTPINEIPGQGNVVSQAGTGFGTGGTAACMLRKFEIPRDGRNFYTNQFTNTGVASAIQQFTCASDSHIAVSAKAAMVTKTGADGRNLTYVPISIGGGTLGATHMRFDGTLGAIDAGDSDYIVAALARDDVHFDTLVVMREAFKDRYGRTIPGIEYEAQLPGHEIVDLKIDENQGMLFIATRFQGNFGKIIAYNLSDADALRTDSLSSIVARSQGGLPANTYQRNPYNQPNHAFHAFDAGQGNSVFTMTVPPKSMANFDGLTATLTADGRIFLIEDIHGANLSQNQRAQMEQYTGTSVDPLAYYGSRSGFLWDNVKNTRTAQTSPGSFTQRYNDVAVGNNVFYAIADSSVYFSLGGRDNIVQSSVPRERNLLMGELTTISLNNQENLALITSRQGAKVCHVYGNSLNCGPSSSADLTERAGATILGGAIMPRTFNIEPGSEQVQTQQVSASTSQETDS